MGARRTIRCAMAVLGLVAAAGLTITVTASAGPVTPLTLDPSRTLLDQWDYAPDYIRNIPAFDPLNRPYIRSRWASQDDTSYVHVLEQGSWMQHEFVSTLKAAYPDFTGTINAGGWATDRVVFDQLGRAYQILTIRLEEGEFKNVLLYSLDACHTWSVVELPFGDAVPRYDWRNWGNMAMEHEGRVEPLQGPPFLMFWKQIAPWKGVWASRHKLYVVRPRFEGDALVLPEPKLVSSYALCPVQCAGGSSYAATAGGRTYFVFARVAPLGTATTPTYASYFDHASGAVAPRVLIGGAPPANDSHCTPGLCLDSKGYLHVVMGSHGRSFQYSRSVRPYDVRGWTRKQPVLLSGLKVAGTDADGRGSQTYVSLACDQTDTLHLLFRQSRKGVDKYRGGRRHDTLSYQRKAPGRKWTKPVVLVRSPSVYAQFYQKLAVDRSGRLFAAGAFWTDHEPTSTRLYCRFRCRFVLFSGDAGSNWSLATSEDFASGFEEPLR